MRERAPNSTTGHRHTFVFADLAGFTALTEVHGDDRAADLAVEFCRGINRRLPAGAEDLKMLGDACLLRLDSALEAIELGLALSSELAARHGFPDVRVGMNTGTAVRRGDEWFGAAINIAARVVALAGPGEVLLTAVTHDAVTLDAVSQDAAAPWPGLRLVEAGVHGLRHLAEPVRLYRALREASADGQQEWAVDPVCWMRLDPAQAVNVVAEDGTSTSFCSRSCAAAFARDRHRYNRHFAPGC